MEEKIRINKLLSEIGYCSRREADRLVSEGRITCNGKTLSVGEQISRDAEIAVDGKKLEREEKKVLLLFYKPRGIVCSTRNQFGDTTVIDYIKYPLRVYPVGRLDKDSEGLLLLTNEGELVNQIMRARNFHEKEYLVTVNKPITDDFLKKMSSGVRILDQATRPCKIERTGEKSFRIILTQGLNRQIRRMCEALGYEVRTLKRIRIMNLTLEGLKTGEYREITKDERKKLDQLLTISATTSDLTAGGTYGRKTAGNKGSGKTAERGIEGLLPGRQRDHGQSGVRRTVRQASGSRERNRNHTGRKSHR